jgi:tetratricopeptide (TPR) repeat protein
MLEQGQVESARQAVDEILKADPKNPAAHTLRGRVLLEQQKYGDARLAFEKALSFDDRLADAWFGLGVVAQASDDHAAALESYQKALVRNPNHTDTILAVANTLEVLNRRQEAAELLDVKIADNPSDTQLLCAAAELAGRMNQPDKAVSLYRRAATIEPENMQILHTLAMTYMSCNRWSDAADVFEKLLTCAKPDKQQDYLYWTATTNLNAGRFRRALECFDQLSVSRRKDPEIWLGIAQSALGISDINRAKTCAQKALFFKADCSDAKMVLGCADYLDGKYMTALQSFNSMTRDEKFGGFASFMAGRCYLKLGRTAPAQAAFEKAIRLNPQSPLVAMFLKEPEAKNEKPETTNDKP